ncbi:MAG: FecR domain-containing protein [Treponema sp.]|nr:FecR domain-containing protein [Treponema sp.]
MQKKIKSKSRKTDILVTLLCISISVFFIFLFWKDLNGMTKRDEADAVGRISFKHRTAQRKFNDRIAWERIAQDSSVYNEDTIRTAAMSQATLKLKDGTVVNLGENSMVQIHYGKSGKVEISIDEGEAVVDATESGQSVDVKFAGGETAKIDAGATVSVNTGDGGSASIDTLSGSATVTTKSGGDKQITAGESIFVEDGNVQMNALSIISPRKNKRILKFASEKENVPFEWKFSDGSENENVIIEISEQKNFSTILQKLKTKDEEKTSVAFGSGTFYWRAYTPSTKEKPAAGKIEVVQIDSPTLLFPVQNALINRRESEKSATFRWTESDFAEHYRLRISKYADMHEPTVDINVQGLSAVVEDIGDGEFWWQITPYFSLDNIGYANPSKTQLFSLKTAIGDAPPELISPGHGIKITYGEKKQSQIFSWKTEREESPCKITISKTENFSMPIFTKEIGSSKIEFPIETLASDEGEDYFWKVTQMTNGGKALESETRRFTVRKERKKAIGQVRLLYPNDNFSCEEEKLRRTQFIWNKENVNADQEIIFQISKSEDFSATETEQKIKGNMAEGISLPTGTFYWRVGCVNSENGESKTDWTEARRFSVLKKLAESKITYPIPSEDVVLYKDAPLKMSWQGVPVADFYNVKIHDADGKLVAQNASATGNGATFSLQKGSYTASIQAVALSEEDISSQRTGPVTTVSFRIRQPEPVSLFYPDDGEEIDGLTALRNPQNFIWNDGIDKAFTKKFVLYKKTSSGAYSEVESQKVSGGKTSVTRLTTGEYKWKIEASTQEGLPLDSEERHFTVSAVPELLKAVLVSPRENFTMTAEYLRKNRTIVFKWNSVEGATSYTFKFYRKLPNGALKLIKSESFTKKTKIEFSELYKLDVGTFVWTVTAYAHSKSGFEEQHSKTSRGEFKIRFDIPKTAVPLEPGRMYGE